MKKWEKRKGGMSEPRGRNCHNSEGAGVLETVDMATKGQTQETAGGDDASTAK